MRIGNWFVFLYAVVEFFPIGARNYGSRSWHFIYETKLLRVKGNGDTSWISVLFGSNNFSCFTALAKLRFNDVFLFHGNEESQSKLKGDYDRP